MSFLAYWTGRHDDFLSSGRMLYQFSITNSAKHSSQTYRRAGQRCFGLLALISRPQVRYTQFPEELILPRLLIPAHKYILKNLTPVVRIYSCVYVTTLVKSFTWQGWRSITKKSNVLPGLLDGMSRRLFLVGGWISTPSPTVPSTPVKRTVERDSAVLGH